VTTRSRQTFGQIVTLPDLAIPLAEAALLLACEEYPHLALGPYLDFLDLAAARVRQTIPDDADPETTIDGLNRVLFGEYGFTGNLTHYYDARNSFLNEVIERRTGIPITLSAVYMSVAARLDFPLDGIGLPGHFIVRHRRGPEDVFLDPFNDGARMTLESLREITGNAGGGTDIDPWLRRSTHKEILSRMLNNLRRIYLKAQAFDKALAMTDLMLITDPSALDLYRQRGLLRLRTHQFEGAARDLGHFLRHQQKDLKNPALEAPIRALARLRAMLN
jgi:regulator of sirC expression with transglutaminase-like and TPR domain